jgi:hypothetical protein
MSATERLPSQTSALTMVTCIKIGIFRAKITRRGTIKRDQLVDVLVVMILRLLVAMAY